MAGYDVEFPKPAMPEADIRALLRTFRRIAANYRVTLRYRTSTADGTPTLSCLVDGPLSGMQRTHDDFANCSEGYLLAIAARDGIGHARRTWEQLYHPFLIANAERVQDMAEIIFGLNEDFGFPVATPLPEDVRLERFSRSLRLSSAQRFAVASFVQMFRLWRDREVLPINAIVAFDQSFELFLKGLAGVQPNRRLDYPDLLSMLRAQGMLDGRESQRLSRFHTSRNRCQHRGYRVRARTVDSLAHFGRALYWKLLRDNYT